ncbi:MAG: DUF4329 domain-containing protein [Pseudomonadota bacterium]
MAVKRQWAWRWIALLAIGALAACDSGRVEAPPPSADFTERAIGFLDGLQNPSFTNNREFCGYFGFDANGTFAASGPHRGEADSCTAPFPGDIRVIASYHTHGAHGAEFDAEVPSPEDVESDMAEGVFGYISTPGGRVWLVDWRDGSARQLCGRRCVLPDPDYDSRDVDPVSSRYSLQSLEARFGL